MKLEAVYCSIRKGNAVSTLYFVFGGGVGLMRVETPVSTGREGFFRFGVSSVHGAAHGRVGQDDLSVMEKWEYKAPQRVLPSVDLEDFNGDGSMGLKIPNYKTEYEVLCKDGVFLFSQDSNGNTASYEELIKSSSYNEKQKDIATLLCHFIRSYNALQVVGRLI